MNGVSSASDGSPAPTLNIPKPEGQTVEQYIQQVTDFWTDERLKAAVPKPLIRIDSLPIRGNISDRRSSNENGKQTVIQGTVPASFRTLKRAGYPNTVGKVFFVDGSGLYGCSASVVTANNKDMVFTAGHCVYSRENRAYVTNFVFIPQYENGARPYGTWAARALYAMSNWVSSLDWNSDAAIAVLYTLNGQHIQEVVGSQGVSFNSGHSGLVSAFGYPRNYFDGEIMTSCTETKYNPKDDPKLSWYAGDALPCPMNQGASGGPWFESFNVSTLTGTQTSVNSFIRTDLPNVMYGPHFGSDVQSLYDKANSTPSSKAKHGAFSLFLLFILQQCLQNSFFK